MFSRVRYKNDIIIVRFQIVAFYHFESYNSVIFVHIIPHSCDMGKVTIKLYLNYVSLNVCATYTYYLVEIVL